MKVFPPRDCGYLPFAEWAMGIDAFQAVHAQPAVARKCQLFFTDMFIGQKPRKDEVQQSGPVGQPAGRHQSVKHSSLSKNGC